ncbi:hypothetical protein EA472_05485 [Natrarchaeobius oligotrophus]|uniref:DUF7511 domain-containing protein n=1 Tax=Natrarchaeobius chitinivorans TaxID=1679083 RepID=A0A3N6MK95_NATCH|nr:hypothetical protein EA472_05485 [Natrarchaeobius chitinivorans]
MTDTDPPSPSEHPTDECRAIVEPTETGEKLCTIYSLASEDSLVTTWISAREGSYCALRDVR